MEQKNDEQVWENKALREARESSHKNAVSLLDIAERIGCLKNIETLEELFVVFNGVRNQLFDQIYQDIPLHAAEIFSSGAKTPPKTPQTAPPANNVPAPTPTPPATSEPNDASPKMKKMIWAIVFGDNGTEALVEELKTMGLDRFNVTKKFINSDWAHDFIDRNK